MYTLTCTPPKTTSPPTNLADGPSASAVASRASGSASPSATLAPSASASAPVTPGALTLAGDVPDSSTVGAQYDGTVTVTGGTGPYSWSASGLPKGMRARPDGATLVLSGAPGTAGTFPLQVSVSDASAPARMATETVNVTIAASGQASTPLTLTPASGTVSGQVGQSFSQTFTVSGGVAPYTWSAGTLPAGLAGRASGSTFTIAGRPAGAGSTVTAVSVTDSEPAGNGQQAQVTIDITAPDNWQVTGPPTLPDGTVGSSYNAGDTVTGGVTVRWSASGLPPGLAIDPASGTISGTPAAVGSYSVDVSATSQATGETRSAGGQSLTITDPATAPPSPTSS
jgi:hypothetical protein